MASASLIAASTFTLTDRIKIQQDAIRKGAFRKIGKLTSILMDRQMSTRGLSQSRPRYSNPDAAKQNINEAMQPFSEWQMNAWVLMTIDWLAPKNAPTLALSHDRNDLLLPYGLTPLPKIPDPLFVPKEAGQVTPRVEQRLYDRAYRYPGEKEPRVLKDSHGRRWFLFQPISELSVFLLGVGGNSGFGRIRGTTSPVDHTHFSLLVDCETESKGYFASGGFEAGF